MSPFMIIILKNFLAWSVFAWAVLSLLKWTIVRCIHYKEKIPIIRLDYVIRIGILFALWWLIISFQI